MGFLHVIWLLVFCPDIKQNWFTGSGCVNHCKVMSRISQLMLTSYVSVYVCSGQLVIILIITIISKVQILKKPTVLYKEHDGSGELVDVHACTNIKQRKQKVNIYTESHCCRVHVLVFVFFQSWLDMSTEMIHYEQEDLSNILSRVCSRLGILSVCLDIIISLALVRPAWLNN